MAVPASCVSVLYQAPFYEYVTLGGDDLGAVEFVGEPDLGGLEAQLGGMADEDGNGDSQLDGGHGGAQRDVVFGDDHADFLRSQGARAVAEFVQSRGGSLGNGIGNRH